jgi:acetyl/propionyl-CoA carboxylase alpha subunit
MSGFKSMAMAALAAALLLASAPEAARAQQAAPPKLSTNPGKHVVFPAKGQTAEQQEKDQADAYAWATQQTGWDPYKAYDELAKKDQAASQTADATRGSAVKGAVGGALLGLAIGAIADDAGKGAAIGATAGGLTRGMRGRQVRKQAESGVEAGMDEYKVKFQNWDKHFVVAMEGKGYTIK